GELCGSPPALLRTPAADSGGGALPRRAVAGGGRAGGIDGSGPTTASGLVAIEFRSDLAGADGAAGEADGDPADGGSAETWPAVWSRQAAGGGGSRSGGLAVWWG